MRPALALILALAACGGSTTRPDPKDPKDPKETPDAVPVASETTWDKLEGQISAFEVAGAGAAEPAIKSEIETLLRSETGHTLDRARLRDVLTSMIRVRGVAGVTLRGVQISPDRMKLVADVEVHPTLKALAAREKGGGPVPIAGGSSMAGGVASAEIGQRLDPTRIDKIAADLRERYRGNGFRTVEVTWSTAPSPGGVDVTLEIVPGEALSIGAIDVAGNKGLRREEIVKVLGKSLVVGQPVRDEVIERASLELSELYWDRGYANIHITTPDLPSSGKATLTYRVAEGPMFRIGKLTIKGAIPAAENAAYVKLMGVKTGDVFSRTAIVNGRQRVSEKLAKDGKPNANVVPITKVDLDKKTIDLTFEIDP